MSNVELKELTNSIDNLAAAIFRLEKAEGRKDDVTAELALIISEKAAIILDDIMQQE